jgi:hypothetical protein
MEKNEAPADAPVSNRGRPRCVDCTAVAPPTGTDYTLISAQFGWRLTRSRTPANGSRMEWRCPACYAHARTKGGA